ncbi:hypothetical protein HPT25_23725 [Bacillus sp. BRMEA1]|uniref:YqaI family protein n=1 Tax=Neobacillus endophyticus TaxID=2738405 RepID=UPI00156706A7|nr:hypothetical protein [Neobacillus endophyticus]NRD80336.1 hypothetical protein [Neobacillus endophyticus]
MRDLENPMCIDAHWRHLETASGLENVLAQPECAGIDFFGDEIFEGECICIDHDNFDEIVLREHLKRYCVEQLQFIFRGGLVRDRTLKITFDENSIESHLVDHYNFEFRQAD